MHWTRAGLVSGITLAAVAGLHAQSIAFNRDMIVLDPAHGGADTGARIDDQSLEKDVTLSLVGKLRSLLSARGFTVVSTREDDASGGTTDQRADAANKTHAVACLVIHASASAGGVYIGASPLGSPLSPVPPVLPASDPSRAVQPPSGAVPWDRAQEAWVPQSLRLQGQIATALSRSNLTVAQGRAALKPLDNLMCPAITVEIGTLVSGSDRTPVSDSAYQQKVAEAIAGALVFWRNQAQPPQYVPLPGRATTGAAQ